MAGIYQAPTQEAILTGNTVLENQATGTAVGTFIPADASYTLTAEVPDNQLFSIVDQQLVTADSLNFEEQSSYTIEVNVTFADQVSEDNEPLSSLQKFVITVVDSNDPPVVQAQVALRTAQEVPITLALANFTVTDEDAADSGQEGFSLQVVAGENYTVSGQTTITPDPAFIGFLTVPITVNDGNDNSEVYPAIVTVVAPEVKIPTFTLAQEVYTVEEDFATPARVEVQPDDLTQQITYEIFPDEVDFATLTADNSQGVYEFSALPHQNGEEEFTIKATNEQQKFFERAFTFRVNPVNDPPSFERVNEDDQRILVGSPAVTVPQFVTNVSPGPTNDEAGQVLAFQLQAGNPALFVQPPTIDTQGTLTYQPANDQVGTTQVTVSLVDNGSNQPPHSNASAPQQFGVEVFAPQVSAPQLSNDEVSESQPAGTLVGELSADGINPKFTILSASPDPGAFRISGSRLETAKVLSYETASEHEVEIRARAGFIFKEDEDAKFTIKITNIPEPPTGVTLNNQSIAEGSPAGSTVGTLSAQGGAPEVPVLFSLVDGRGGEDNAQFTIDGNRLKINVVPDVEVASQYNVLVKATGDGDADPQPFVITVTNVLEPPTNIVLTSTTVAEGAETNRTVGNLSVEGGAAVPITYTLSGPGRAAFAIAGNALVTKVPLNFEATAEYPITIAATGDGTFSKSFVIGVANVEEPPTNIVLSNNSVTEGQEIGTPVGTLSATGGEPVTSFELVRGGGASGNQRFVIEAGVLKTAEVLDFEADESHTIRVRATGDGSLEKVLTIDIIDQPDPPTDIALSSTTVSENLEAGAVVGTLSAIGGEGPYQFRMVGNRADNGAFAIEGQELRTTQVFDFEASPTLNIVVQARNDDGRLNKAFTITVQNVEEPPTDITLSSATIQESQPEGTVVGTLSATRGGDAPTFRLVGGAGSNNNNQFVIDGNLLKSRGAFDFEEKQTYTVRVQATADGSFAKPFEITIINIPEPPTEIRLSSATVAENQPIGSEVGTFTAVNGSGNVTYTLIGNNNDKDKFRIDNRLLLTDAVFDRETRDTYRIRVRATDDGSIDSTFTITIDNIDEPPVLSQIESTFLEYAEGDEAKTITQSLRISDPDTDELANAIVFFSGGTYVKGEDELALSGVNVAFDWNADQGRLTIRGPLGRARMQNALRAVQYKNLKTINPTASTRRVSFRANDGSENSNLQERFIRVSNSNIPPVLTDIVLSTNEDNATAIPSSNFASAYGGDEDGNGFSGTISVLTLPAQGVLTVDERTLTDDDLGRQGYEVNFDAGSTLVYTPQENVFGPDGFQWTALDNQNEQGIAANVTINVLPTNDAPVIVAPATLNVEENTEDPLMGISITEPDNDSVLVTLSVDRGLLALPENIRSSITLTNGSGDGDAALAFWGTTSTVNEVMASLFYTPDASPGDAALTITITDAPENGGEPLTTQAAITLVIVPQNDDPVLAAINPDTLFFIENSLPLIVADSIQVTDEENDAIIAAVVAIDSGYTVDDLLIFENTEAISATQAEGILTLTGNASAAAYQDALRSVAFQNTSDRPNPAPRTLRFEVTDATGGRSNSLQRVVSVVAVEDSLQIVDLELAPLYFAVGSTPVFLSRSVRPDDPDSETIDQVIVSLAPETYVAADDSLGSSPVGEIVSSWDAEAGTLTLSGTATLAEYEQSLRTLTYYNRNQEATESSRVVQIQGFSGEIASEVVTREIVLINNVPPVVNDLTVVVLAGTSYPFTTAIFQDEYSDQDNRPSADGLSALRIVSLPRQGTLLRAGTLITQQDVDAGLIIAAEEISQLSYVSNQGYLGEDRWMWNAFDGAEFAADPASVIITISDLQVSLGEPLEKCLNIDSLQLEATVQGGTEPYRFIWSSDQEESIPKNSSIAAVLPAETTTYRVAVTDADGITVTDSVRVTIIACPDQELDIPSAFTPDGDGMNDVWEVGNILTYENSVVEVYDRFGHRLFRSEGYAQPWNGTYQGKDLPVGTYYYTISLNEGVAHYKGSVTILK